MYLCPPSGEIKILFYGKTLEKGGINDGVREYNMGN